MNQLINTTEVQTMSSREIAELTGKEHKHVLRDVRAMIEQLKDGPDLDHEVFQQVTDSRGYTSEYLLTKNQTLLLMTGYSVPLRQKLINRWHELEELVRRPALPDFSNPAEAARAWANEYEQKQLALQRVEQLELVVEETTKYYSLMRVLIANPESHLSKYTAWRPLKKYCQEHKLEIKKTWDDRYGSVNLYPREAWEEIYPYIELPDECAVLLGEAKDEP
ncbi:TPA: Rha family transcriptional regulator [Escherichia coli]|nr:Rha family transcriptional regulator [Escherichia coli]EHX1936845.1 Rha family transcriptional regulator [Escherichia coli]